ncbi:MAG: NAD-dependent protein deacylase [Sedimentisphaerales bacterium]|nr:NAD-dependent protein deacylase [Sedimentisphaerales bacterium]
MLTYRDEKQINRVVEILHRCSNILFITGAGVSADSGLPTYRGIGGLYNEGQTEEGIDIEEALSGEMMLKNPQLCWKYIGQIEKACRGAKFNRAHEVISEMERHFHRLWTLTQNVDGFHRDAGSRNLIEMHGNVHQLMCTSCSWRQYVADYSDIALPPYCPDCGALVRPEVVLFGEILPMDKYYLLCEELAQGFDIIFSVGTTSVFPYIAEPVWQAQQKHIPTVEINPGHTEVSDIVNIKITTAAALALNEIWNRYRQK